MSTKKTATLKVEHTEAEQQEALAQIEILEAKLEEIEEEAQAIFRKERQKIFDEIGALCEITGQSFDYYEHSQKRHTYTPASHEDIANGWGSPGWNSSNIC